MIRALSLCELATMSDGDIYCQGSAFRLLAQEILKTGKRKMSYDYAVMDSDVYDALQEIHKTLKEIKMTTELTTQKTNLPTTPAAGLQGLNDLIFDDLKQSYWTLLHPNSKALSSNDNFKAGHIVNSETGEILGGKGKPIDVYPVNFARYWYESDVTKPNEMPKKFLMTASNCGISRLEGNTKRVSGYEFYCFTRGTVDTFPAILSFRGTSATAAKTMITYLVKNKLDLYGHGFQIDSASKQNKAGQNYFYLTAKPSTPTTEAERKNGSEWLKRTEAIKQTSTMVEDSDDDSEKVPF